ncbi:hypothetical protein B0H10DRAFT_2049764, partial [Mycena sp. CBHHK59/15]
MCLDPLPDLPTLSYGSCDFYCFDNAPSQVQNRIQKVRPYPYLLLISSETNEYVLQNYF